MQRRSPAPPVHGRRHQAPWRWSWKRRRCFPAAAWAATPSPAPLTASSSRSPGSWCWTASARRTARARTGTSRRPCAATSSRDSSVVVLVACMYCMYCWHAHRGLRCRERCSRAHNCAVSAVREPLEPAQSRFTYTGRAADRIGYPMPPATQLALSGVHVPPFLSPLKAQTCSNINHPLPSPPPH